MAREDRDSQYGGGSYSSQDNKSDRGQSYGGGGGDAREKRRTEQYTSQATKDLAAGVGGGIGTLADPREKQDYFGSTIFGPSRKYTGSFLDNILGGGYRAVQPYAPDQFQSRFSQAGGLGKSVFGGILGLINPMAGMLYRVASSVPGGFEKFKSSPTLADYFSNFNFGENKNISDVYANQGRGSGLRNTGIMSTMPIQNIDPNFYSNAVAELTDKQKNFINNKKFVLEEGMISPEEVYKTITDPDLNIYDDGTFGFGAQDPTTKEEYNDYLRSLGLTVTI
jgi:hypothetical protein